jgi:hypothetical protein
MYTEITTSNMLRGSSNTLDLFLFLKHERHWKIKRGTNIPAIAGRPAIIYQYHGCVP